VDVVDLVRAELADLPATEQRAALPLSLVAALLVALPASAGAALSESHLNLRLEVVVVQIVGVDGAPLARLAHGRQPALDAPALRIGLALGARAVDDFLLLVDADDHVADHLVHDAQPAIELLHQLAAAVDDLEDVHALFLVRDLVGETLAAPVLGL